MIQGIEILVSRIRGFMPPVRENHPCGEGGKATNLTYRLYEVGDHRQRGRSNPSGIHLKGGTSKMHRIPVVGKEGTEMPRFGYFGHQDNQQAIQ